MPSRCVAAGCSNTIKDGVSLHRFPSDPKYRQNTTKVKLTRVKWSEHSFLCKAHFEQTCFEQGLHSQFGMAYMYKAILLPDEIPTIFPLSKKAVKAPTKKRGAFLKRMDLDISVEQKINYEMWMSETVNKSNISNTLDSD